MRALSDPASASENEARGETPRPPPGPAGGAVWLWLAAVVTGAVVVGLIELPRLGRGPLPDELLAPPPVSPLAGLLPVPRLAPLLALGAGLVAATLVCAFRRWRAAAGGFGTVAAAALAAAATSGFLMLAGPRPPEQLLWATGPVAGLACAALAPLLRDRGMVSLLVTALLIGGAVIPARRQAMTEATVAEQLTRARDAVLYSGLQRLLISVAPDLPLAFRQALTISLRPPHFDEPVDLLCVDHDSDEESSLVAAGWRGVRLSDGAPTTLAAATPAAPKPYPFQIAVRQLQDRGPVAVIQPPEGDFTLHVVTPVGVFHQNGSSPIHGLRLLGDAFDRYRQRMAPLPEGCLIVLRVETLLMGGSPWFELR